MTASLPNAAPGAGSAASGTLPGRRGGRRTIPSGAHAAWLLLVAAALAPGPGAAEGVPDDADLKLSRIEQATAARDRDAARDLAAWARTDGNEEVRERSVGALALLQAADAVPDVINALGADPSPRVRRAAAEAIGILKPVNGYMPLESALTRDADPYVRAECARALGRIGEVRTGAALIAAVARDPSPEVRALSSEALEKIRTPGSTEILEMAARGDPSTLVRIYAIRALSGAAAPAPLFRSIWEETSDPDLRVEAFQGLLAAGDAAPWDEKGLSDLDERIRFLSFRSWLNRNFAENRRGGMIPETPDPRLESYLSDPVQGIRELARRRLEDQGFRVRPKGFGYTVEPK